MGDFDLRFYLSILWRRSPYVTLIAVTTAAIAVAFAVTTPKVYRATSKILVEAPQIPLQLARSTVSTNAVDQMLIVQQQATTNDNVLRLAAKLNIYGDEASEMSNEDIIGDMRSRMVFEQTYLSPVQSLEATVFDVAFEANDPQLAADVANELTKLILDRNAQQRTDRAGDTLQFFEREVGRLKSDLAKVEADILKFKNENSETLPDSLEFRRSQQMSQQQSLLSLEREQSELRSRRNTLVLVYETTGQVAKSGPITFEQQQLLDLHRALSDQLAIFSENSPNIQALRKRIASLQAGLGDRQTATEQSGDKEIKSELDLQLADIDERLQFIGQSQVSIRETIAKLGQTIAATPANETTLNALERNRENIQSQYNAAVERLAEASTGQQIEAMSKGVRFSILEPAIPPQDAIRPSRKRIAGLGVAGGLGMGFGLIALLEIFNMTIRRPAELMSKLQIQPLATIPYIAEPVQYKSKFISGRLAIYSIVALALIFGISALYFIFPDIFHRMSGIKLAFGGYS